MRQGDFFSRIRGVQGIGAREIDDVEDLSFDVYLTMSVLDSGSRKIRCLGFQPSDSIEESALPAVGLTYKNDVWIFIFFGQ